MKVRLPSRINLKIISATSVVLFTLLVSFVGVYSWFEATRSSTNEGDQFNVTKTTRAVNRILVYNFIEENNGKYVFNATPASTVDLDDAGSRTINFKMESFSIDDPNKPVLFVLEAEEGKASINFKTESNYYPPKTVATVTNYSDLSDEYEDGDYITVTTDATHENNTSIYKFHKSTTSYEYIPYEDISTNRPLSSIVQTNWFYFEDSLFNYDSVHDTWSFKTGTATIEEETSESSTTEVQVNTISIPTSYVVSGHKASFVNFDTKDNPVFNKTMTIFEGSIESQYNNPYIGFVLDYNQASLEYIYSYYLGLPIMSEGLSFACDWKMEV